MKKFIRTADGIYEIVDFDDECIIPSPIIKMNDKLTHCSDYKNYKQANTIKELCDTYVIVGEDKNKDGNPVLWSIKQDIPFLMKYFFKRNVIYSAIWTSKGLIYVAKMNDEGKLCLI